MKPNVTQFSFILGLVLLIFTSIAFTHKEAFNFSIKRSTNEPLPIKQIIQVDNPVKVTFEDMNEWLRNQLEINEQVDFVFSSQFSDKIGFTHYKFHQTYKGKKVQDGVFIIHAKQGYITAANGEYYSEIELNSNPLISPEQALEIGKASINAETWAWDEAHYPLPDIFVVKASGAYHFAYKTDIYSYNPMVHKWTFIDIETGEILTERNQISHFTVPGEAHCMYHGTQTIMVDSIAPNEFLLRDYSRGDGIITQDLNGGQDVSQAVDFVDTDNIWDTTTNFDNAALDVHWATALMYDYMLETHGWESYDNQGAAVRNYIHNFNNGNSYWTGTELVYGDGDGSFLNPLVAAEVMGHEFMHAYSNTIADFNLPHPEIGGVSEAYSDIFSVIVESNISPSTANYLIGDMVTVSGQPLRDMSDPNSLNHPDTYLGDFWSNTNFSANSNVLNYLFYLLTQGGTGTNGNGDDYTVSAISMDDAADILFRALSVYMTSNTGYLDTRTYGIQSCIDLFGPCSPQEVQFTNACYAVGIGAEYAGPPITEIESIEGAIINTEIAFSSNATTAINWEWDFGDNMNSTEEMPTHVYQTAGIYEVSLSATYPNGCVQIDTYSITITSLSNLEELEKQEITVYPNPVQDKLFVVYNGEQKISNIRFINALGQAFNVVDYQAVSNIEIKLDLEDFPTGIYFLELEMEGKFSIFEKVYVQ